MCGVLAKPGEILRNLLERPGALVAPGAYDGISARLIQEAGFEALYRTGGGTSASLLGQPDLGLLTMVEMAAHAARIAAAVEIPVIADADTGYGNALNVVRTVHEFERAGVAAIHLEDQVFPKRCGFLAGKDVISREEFVAKVKAAVNERSTDDLVIIARTDARQVEGLDQAIERCKYYADAGAEVLFFEAPESIADIEEIGKELSEFAPLMINMSAGSKTPPVTSRELEQMGYKLVIYPGICMFNALGAMREALQYLKDNETDDGASGDREAVGPFELFEALGLSRWRELEEKYRV